MSKVQLLVILFVVLMLAGYVGWRVMSKGTQALTQSIPQSNQASSSAQISQDPFYDLTIPGLRARQYTSQLAVLQPYQSSGSYNSYLTSYTSDGLKINGLLTRPTGEMPVGGWPAIVFIHGYIPPRTYATTERYISYVDYLARNGFVVFKIDLRGHGDSEGEPGGSYYSSDYIIDTLNAYAALQSTDFVNPKKVGLWGHSMAGNISLRSLAVKPEIPAVVIWAGAGYSYLDLRQYGISDASYQPLPSPTQNMNRRQRLIQTHGQPSADDPFWKLMAPTNYLSELKGAIALHHAVDDSVVNVNYSRNLNSLLDQTKVPHQFFEYPNGDHNIASPSFESAMQRTVEFYKKYL